MSSVAVTDVLVEAIEGREFELIVCNYANPDMVGHTGDFDAAVQAIEAIDKALGRILEALNSVGGELLVTADHGNADQMRDPSNGQPHTAHSNNPVPLVYVGRRGVLDEGGALCDIAPTLLNILGLDQPDEMTGRSLLKLD
jgi:2,3-bisphosphoglycerate-independent phosphoglycerate mutase